MTTPSARPWCCWPPWCWPIFLGAQMAWYRRKLAIGWGVAAYLAIRGLVLASLIMIAIFIPIAYI